MVSHTTTRPMKQLQFRDNLLKKPKDQFGGTLLKGNNPKCKRPLDSKYPIHLVLRAKKGGMRRLTLFNKVNDMVEACAKRHGVKVYRYANVGNHLHMVIRLSKISRWASFIRELTGKIAFLMRANRTTEAGEGYWLHRPFTRIVRSWKKGFKNLCEYVHLNVLEAQGFIKRKDTKTLKDLRAIWAEP